MVKKQKQDPQKERAVLLSPDGREYEAVGRAEITRLTQGHGYRRKSQEDEKKAVTPENKAAQPDNKGSGVKK